MCLVPHADQVDQVVHWLGGHCFRAQCVHPTSPSPGIWKVTRTGDDGLVFENSFKVHVIYNAKTGVWRCNDTDLGPVHTGGDSFVAVQLPDTAFWPWYMQSQVSIGLFGQSELRPSPTEIAALALLNRKRPSKYLTMPMDGDCGFRALSTALSSMGIAHLNVQQMRTSLGQYARDKKVPPDHLERDPTKQRWMHEVDIVMAANRFDVTVFVAVNSRADKPYEDFAS